MDNQNVTEILTLYSSIRSLEKEMTEADKISSENLIKLKLIPKIKNIIENCKKIILEPDFFKYSDISKENVAKIIEKLKST